MKKKWITMALTMVLLSALAAGCATPSSDSPAVQQTSQLPANTTASAAPEMPPPAELLSLTLGVSANPNVQNYDTNYLTGYIEEKMDVDLEFVSFPHDVNERKTKFSLLVTSSSQLPDVMSVNFDDMTVFDYATKGVFINLKPYLDNPESAKYFYEMPEQNREFVYGNLIMPDNGIYSLLRYFPNPWNEAGNRAWINQEWMDALGLETPGTTDEFYEVLVAFRDGDPNGNGKKDEIPMVGATGGWGADPIPYLMNAFTYADPNKNYLHVENGQMYASFIRPEWRDGLEYIQMLVSEELLSPLSFTQDDVQLKALNTAEIAVVGVSTAGSYSMYGPNPSPTASRTVLLNPLTGTGGECNVARTPALPTPYWMITSSCTDPDLAFRVGDYLLSNEIYLIGRWGEPEVSWTKDPAVLAEYRTETGIPVEVVKEFDGVSLWSQPQNVHWQGEHPSVNNLYPQDRAMGWMKQADYDALAAEGKAPSSPLLAFYDMYIPNFPETAVGRLPYTMDEAERISVLSNAISTYVKTSIAEFATSVRPMSGWDNYLADLNNLGLEEYLNIIQGIYDRTYG